MSNGHRLEFLRDGEGGWYLNYWDALNGKDCIIHFQVAANTILIEDHRQLPPSDSLNALLLHLFESVDQQVQAFYAEQDQR